MGATVGRVLGRLLLLAAVVAPVTGVAAGLPAPPATAPPAAGATRAAGALGGAGAARGAATAAGQQTFTAVADTQISSAAPGTAYGAAAKMAVCGAGAARCSDGADEKRALVRFSVSGADGALSRVRLRLYALTAPVPALSVRLAASGSWSEATATWTTASGMPTGPRTSTAPGGAARGWYEADVTQLVSGAGTYTLVVTNPAPTVVRLATKESTTPAAPPQLVVTTPSLADPVLVAAGDVSTRTRTGGNRLTSNLALALDPDRVVVLGDDQYPTGALADYRAYYGPTWGRLRARTHPVPGNHEYLADTSASGYFTYFGAAASPQEPTCRASCKGYYSVDIGDWHLVVLNSNHDDCRYVACSPTSAQLSWLRADLAATGKRCVAAAFHHPRWSSGSHHGNNPAMGPIWDALYAAGVDVVLNGHEHNYERFAKQNPAGAADPAGIRQFVVGTGGNALYGFGATKPNSEARTSTSKGVLRLVLRPTGYDWRFVPAAGSTFTDAGSDTCH